jgi:hypothetical protein
MSWVRGSFVIEDLSKKSMASAYSHIDRRVKSNSDLVEFPNAGARFKIHEVSVPEPLADREAAEDFLDERDDWQRSWNVTVPFYDRENCKPTKKYADLVKRLQTEQGKLAEYTKAHGFSTFKAALVTCTGCGSKLNKDYIKEFCCPLCRHDMRSDTVKNTCERYQQKIKVLQKEIRMEEKKATGKAVVRYLVMFEEYCG